MGPSCHPSPPLLLLLPPAMAPEMEELNEKKRIKSFEHDYLSLMRKYAPTPLFKISQVASYTQSRYLINQVGTKQMSSNSLMELRKHVLCDHTMIPEVSI
jgi:hypothetical protein